MAEPNVQAEPTMEEILASIRRIISEDGEGEAEAAPEATAEKKVEEAPMEEEHSEEPPEIFEKTEEEAVAEPEAEAMPEPEPEADVMEMAEDSGEDILELTDVLGEAPGPEAEAIVSPEAASAASQQFHNLSGMLVRRYPGSENTLEGLVRDMLRPMLKDWLDQNLPRIVEEKVAKEIDRIARGKE